MIFRDIIWIESILEKIQSKHGVTQAEAEYVLKHKPHIRFSEKGHFRGEDVYSALGRTETGRHLIVFFVRKRNRQILPISAREMDRKEKKRYARQKKS